jgi:hypothetical protein
MHKSTALALASLLALANCLAGDLTLTYRMSGKGTHNKSEQLDNQGGETITQYISPTKARVVQPYLKSEGIFDFENGTILTIDHKRKTIMKMSVESLEKMGSMLGSFGLGGKSDNSEEVKVEQLGPDTVLGRPCKKIRVSVSGFVEELSLDPSLQFPVSYNKFMNLFAKTPGEAGTIMKRLGEALAKQKGVPLRTHVTGKSLDTTHEAIAVSTAPLPASTWDLPVGYKVTEMPSF